MRTVRRVIPLLLTLLLMPGCQTVAEGDAARFQAEYEILNGQSNLDGSAVYATLDIGADNPFVYMDEASLRAYFADGTGVLYLGFPECPWCRSLVPVMLEAARAAGVDEIFYYNALDDRDVLELAEDGTLIVHEEGTALYRYLVDTLYDHLGPYSGLEDDSIRRIYFPTTVFVTRGEITAVHIGTVESQTNGYVPLDETEHAALLESLTARMLAVPGDE